MVENEEKKKPEELKEAEMEQVSGGIITPEEIESIQVLKDASATAIYG